MTRRRQKSSSLPLEPAKPNYKSDSHIFAFHSLSDIANYGYIFTGFDDGEEIE